MPRTLFGKLLVVFLLFGGLMTVVGLIVIRSSHEHYHQQLDQTVNRTLAQQYIDAKFFLGDEPLNADTVHHGITKLAEVNPDIDIYLVDRGGGIVASSVPEADRKRHKIDLDPIRAFIGGKVGFPISGTDPREETDDRVFSAATLSVPNCPASFLYIVLRQEDHGKDARRLKTYYELGEGMGVIVTAAILALGASLLILRTLTRPLGKLEDAMQRFRGSNFSELPNDATLRPVEQSDEIERLGRIFGELAERIQAQMQELKRTDSMRRELLTNVSHDLRTPLATLQAHLETLAMKETKLTDAERQDYLHTSITQSHRLSRLVDQLLQAAKLDANQVTVAAEPFQLAELVQDVAQKFELTARSKGVTLNAEIAEGLSLAQADIGLIERVLDNLIENALQHTPSGGQVRLHLSAVAGSIRCAVIDSGPGIPESEQQRIFDRFYRIDKSRSGGVGNAGLGLSIVAQMLALHGTSIHVQSEIGSGAKFWFDLPIVIAKS